MSSTLRAFPVFRRERRHAQDRDPDHWLAANAISDEAAQHRPVATSGVRLALIARRVPKGYPATARVQPGRLCLWGTAGETDKSMSFSKNAEDAAQVLVNPTPPVSGQN